MLDELERGVLKALAAGRNVKPDLKSIAALKDQLANLVTAIATGGMRSSPARGRKLAEVESELELLEAARPEPPVDR